MIWLLIRQVSPGVSKGRNTNETEDTRRRGRGRILTAGSAAYAQDKGTIGIAMPTKTSARWIADGDNMVKTLQAKGYRTDLQYADDDIPNQLAQWRT